MVEEGTKFVPETVKVKLGPPATTEIGFKDVTVGTGLLIVNGTEFDWSPMDLVPMTVIAAVPAIATFDASIAACSSVLETKVVGIEEEFHWTVEPE
jgi:hypothetical protein